MSKASLDRRAAMATLMEGRDDNLLVVPGLGSTTWDLAAAGDNPRNFYLWGAMGGAAMIGLGLALAQPNKRVAVITGDGEMLMGLGALATIGVQQPENLAIIVFDNGLYGETGGQASHTSTSADLVGVARACGIPDSKAISTLSEIESFAKAMQDTSSGPRFANVKIDAANLERVLSNRDGTFIMNRIRGALGHAPI